VEGEAGKRAEGGVWKERRLGERQDGSETVIKKRSERNKEEKKGVVREKGMGVGKRQWWGEKVGWGEGRVEGEARGQSLRGSRAGKGRTNLYETDVTTGGRLERGRWRGRMETGRLEGIPGGSGSSGVPKRGGRG